MGVPQDADSYFILSDKLSVEDLGIQFPPGMAEE
jgi:hypothetical protein